MYSRIPYPTAASSTTVTGTFSFFRASAICSLQKMRKTQSFCGLLEENCSHSAARSPSGIRLWFSHIDREALLLCCSFLQHPQHHSGVWMSQDFLKEGFAETDKVSHTHGAKKMMWLVLTAPSLMKVWQSLATLFLDIEIFSRNSSPLSSITFLQRDKSWKLEVFRNKKQRMIWFRRPKPSYVSVKAVRKLTLIKLILISSNTWDWLRSDQHWEII